MFVSHSSLETEHCENDTSKTPSWISDLPNISQKNRSKTWRTVLSSCLFLNVLDKIQSIQDSARFKGTTSYHIDLFGVRNGITCIINHNHRKRSGRSIAYNLFMCMPESSIWAQPPTDRVVYFGPWNDWPKHAVDLKILATTATQCFMSEPLSSPAAVRASPKTLLQWLHQRINRYGCFVFLK